MKETKETAKSLGNVLHKTFDNQIKNKKATTKSSLIEDKYLKDSMYA